MNEIARLKRRIKQLEKERDTYQEMFFALMERYINGEDEEIEEGDYNDEEGD